MQPTLAEALADVAGVEVGAQGIRVVDEGALRRTGAQALARRAIFSSDPLVRQAARDALWQLARSLGIYSASTHALYAARARGEWQGMTVPAVNLRFLTFDSARAALRAVHALDGLALIFEIARSEMGYTDQRPGEYAAAVVAAAIAEGHRGPLFLQGDHFQVQPRRDRAAEVEALTSLVDEALEAGFRNIDIDASTVVDLSRPTAEEAQAENATLTAHLLEHVRRRQPRGVVVSVGGEIGEVGKENSTEEDLRAFLDGLGAILEERRVAPWVSKVSVQTGTHHGGVVLPDGTVAQVQVDFGVHERLSRLCREAYGIGGTVQHGASTLPEELLDRFPQVGCVEIHLATGLQHVVLESLPASLRQEMDDWVRRHLALERGPQDTEEQFLYKSRKKTAGPFKRRLWDLEEGERERIAKALEERLRSMFQRLGVAKSRALVERYTASPGGGEP
jgi:fructose/tagatose bisphosphate aldolase